MANNGSSGWVKWLIILIVVVVIGGGAAKYFMSRGNDKTQFDTTPVTRADVIQAVTATGTLNPVTNVTVGSQISGNILKLYADWNTPVKANQVVAELDPATYKAAVAQADGDLASARATEELDDIEAKRADELSKSKLISDSDHDTAIATLHEAQATVKIKQAALDNAKVNLDRCTIYSPVDGIVISRNVDIGQTVAASLSAPTLFIIANDLTKMQIDANVAEADVGGVETGQKVNFTVDAYPYRTFNGSIVQVRNAPTNYQNVVSYDAVVGVDNKDMKLRPGMTATVSIVIAEKKDVLQIPNAALRFRPPETLASKEIKATNTPVAAGTNAPPAQGGNPGARQGGGGPGGNRGEGGHHDHPGGGTPHMITRTVYILADKADPTKLKPVQIKVGISDGISTEVVDGLNEGDQVVTGLVSASEQGGGRPANPFGGGGGFGRRF